MLKLRQQGNPCEFFLSPWDRLKISSCVSYHYWENIVIVNNPVLGLFLAANVAFSHKLYIKCNLLNHFSEAWTVCVFFQIELMMLEVIHGERGRLGVIVFCFIGKYLFKSYFMKLFMYSAFSIGSELGREQYRIPLSTIIIVAKCSPSASLQSTNQIDFGELSCLTLKNT